MDGRGEKDPIPSPGNSGFTFLSKPPMWSQVSLTGAATWNGSTYEMSGTVDRAVAADQAAGQYLLAGTYPFRVSSHMGGPAGSTIEVKFEPSRIKPDKVPEAASVVVMLAPTGDHFRPSKWDERTWARTDHRKHKLRTRFLQPFGRGRKHAGCAVLGWGECRR